MSAYSGSTLINNGTVQLSTGDNRLPTGTVVNLGQSASANLGLFDLNGRNQEIAGLNSVTGINTSTTLKNTVTNSAATAILTLSGSGSYAYGDGSTNNSGIITGAINLVKNGSGTQTLGDTNSYTGTTTVNTGTLALSGAGSINKTPAITVASGATLDASVRTDGTLTLFSGQTLNGFGTVKGVLTVAGFSTVAPGSVSGLGILTVTSAATLGGTNVMKINKTSGTNDVLSVGGTLTLGGTLNVVNLSGTLAAGDSFKLFNASIINGFVWCDQPAGVGRHFVLGHEPADQRHIECGQSGRAGVLSGHQQFQFVRHGPCDWRDEPGNGKLLCAGQHQPDVAAGKLDRHCHQRVERDREFHVHGHQCGESQCRAGILHPKHHQQ